jgi:hypothetical protein
MTERHESVTKPPLFKEKTLFVYFFIEKIDLSHLNGSSKARLDSPSLLYTAIAGIQLIAVYKLGGWTVEN